MNEQEAIMETLEDYSTAYCAKDIDALMSVFDDGVYELEKSNFVATGNGAIL